MSRVLDTENRVVRQLCSLLGYSRQAWYASCKGIEKQVLEAHVVLDMVRQVRVQLPRVGTRKLLLLIEPQLTLHGIRLGRDAFFDILRDNQLLVRKLKRRCVTTNSHHRFRKYPNLIRNFVAEGPCQLWVSDITYLPVDQGFAYLSLVTDAWSRKIVGHCLHPSLETSGCLKALRMALSAHKDRLKGLIHHSDRGTQYCSNSYVTDLQHHNISISMTEKGDPYENAIAERVNGILKTELLAVKYPDLQAAQQAVNQAVNTYNSLRPHASISMLTPAQAHLGTQTLARTWKSYRKAQVTEFQTV